MPRLKPESRHQSGFPLVRSASQRYPFSLQLSLPTTKKDVAGRWPVTTLLFVLGRDGANGRYILPSLDVHRPIWKIRRGFLLCIR